MEKARALVSQSHGRQSFSRLVDNAGADENLANYFTPRVKFQIGTCNDAGNGNVE